MISYSKFIRRYLKFFIFISLFFLIQLSITIFFLEFKDHANLVKYDFKLNQIKLSNENNNLLTKISKFEISSNQLNFNTKCNLDKKYIISAFNRAKTVFCKNKIKQTFCLNQANNLFSSYLKRSCVLDKNNFLDYVGCFANNQPSLNLKGIFFDLEKKNLTTCGLLCIKYGYQYFGYQNATSCYCSNIIYKNLKTKESICKFNCENDFFKCGGSYAISLYKSGIKSLSLKKDTNLIKLNKISKTSIKIAFVLSLNGRALRQIKRLIKNIYATKHIYFIHVDKRNNYLFDKLYKDLNKYPNIIFSNKRFNTIWGGSDLLLMLIYSMQELIKYDWHYLINLSESDFLVKTLNELELFLSQHEGKNFLKFHGQTSDRFIKKQGLEVLFLQCENRMWRLDNKNLPLNLSYNGGSDWICVHRDFVKFILQPNNDLVNGLKLVYEYTLLPAESFFHTILQNSRFCTTFINSNLHLTNWKRHLGCKCQYKHIVDWCGCSPNVFVSQDWLSLNKTFNNRFIFFARKFDPLIDNEIINNLETKLLNGKFKNHNILNYNKYWQNIYSFSYQNDESYNLKKFIFNKLAYIYLRNYFLRCGINDFKLNQDNIFVSNASVFMFRNQYIGTVISIKIDKIQDNKFNNLQFETIIKSKNYVKFFNQTYISKKIKLISFMVCSDYDSKEDLFKNYDCLLEPESQLIVQLKWILLEKKSVNLTLELVWNNLNTNKIYKNPITILPTEEQIERNLTLNFVYKPNFNFKLQTGVWKLNLNLRNNSKQLIAQKYFLILKQNSLHDKTNLDQVLSSPNQVLNQNDQLKEGTNFSNFKFVNHLNMFWNMHELCLEQTNKFFESRCKLRVRKCLSTSWSTKLPDPKSEF